MRWLIRCFVTDMRCAVGHPGGVKSCLLIAADANDGSAINTLFSEWLSVCFGLVHHLTIPAGEITLSGYELLPYILLFWLHLTHSPSTLGSSLSPTYLHAA